MLISAPYLAGRSGENQGVQFPIGKACILSDPLVPCGAQANMALLLAADVSWVAAISTNLIFSCGGARARTAPLF